jgi:glycosyltransferase involved in cell wall biosynthesis
MRYLFFIQNSSVISGGNKILLGLADRLSDPWTETAICSFGKEPFWYSGSLPFTRVYQIEPTLFQGFDFVFLSNIHLIPMVLPHITRTIPVFINQAYESFMYGNTYTTMLEDCPSFNQILQYPVPNIVFSKSNQELLQKRLGKPSYWVPGAVDKAHFYPRPHIRNTSESKRILMVGPYNMSCKGIQDGLDALTQLSTDYRLTLVWITPRPPGESIRSSVPFPIEVHVDPKQADIPEIMSSCDVCCYPSWYEGLGLPPLESFCCGIPVVCARNMGVSEYGEDGFNLVLVEPNQPVQLYEKLKWVLEHPQEAQNLVDHGYETMVGRYDWETTITAFRTVLTEIIRDFSGPIPMDTATANQLLSGMVEDGVYTPLEVYYAFERISNTLRSTEAQMLREQYVSEAACLALHQLKQEIQPFLINPKTEYYPTFQNMNMTILFALTFFKEPWFLTTLEQRLNVSNRC